MPSQDRKEQCHQPFILSRLLLAAAVSALRLLAIVARGPFVPSRQRLDAPPAFVATLFGARGMDYNSPGTGVIYPRSNAKDDHTEKTSDGDDDLSHIWLDLHLMSFSVRLDKNPTSWPAKSRPHKVARLTWLRGTDTLIQSSSFWYHS